MSEASMMSRVRAIPGRTKLFIGFGVLLAVLGLTGRLQASQDVSIEKAEAIEIGREYLDFEPVNEDARLVRQGFSLVPVWAVSFSIPEDDTAREFKRLTTVEINAENGEVIRIGVDGLGEETEDSEG